MKWMPKQVMDRRKGGFKVDSRWIWCVKGTVQEEKAEW